MNRSAPSFAFAALLLSASVAHAANSGLGVDSNLGLLTFSDLVVSGSSITGGVAVGGNASISGYSIQSKHGTDSLIVGGNLAFSSGSINGDTVVGGQLTSSYGGSFGGDVTVGGSLNASAGLSVANGGKTTVYGSVIGVQPWYPKVTAGKGSFETGLDFSAMESRFDLLSAQLDANSNTGVAQLQWSTLHFDATGKTVAVFDIDAADAARNMQIDGLASNASVIINVHGSSVDFGNHGYTNFGNGQVLFNLPDATSIVFNGGTNASFLAPDATVKGGSGVINGQVIVDNWLSGVQINSVAYSAALPITMAVPEPRTWAMLLGGLLATTAVARRKAAARRL
jgi:choice-of-anchor A domain-containing protein